MARESSIPSMGSSAHVWRPPIPSVMVLALLLLVVWLVFGKAVHYYFAQDDFVFLNRAAQIESLKSWFDLFSRDDHFFRPLPRTILFPLQWRAFGLDAAPYHWTSILLHTVNAWLIFCLCRVTIRRTVISALAAVMYAAHPAHYIAVYWISGSQELCLGLFYSATMLGYLLYLRSGRRAWYWFSMLAFLLGVLSKEMAATLLAILLLVDFVWRSRFRTVSPLSIARFKDAVIPLLIFGLAVYLRITKTDGIPVGPYAPDFTLSSLLESLRWLALEMLYARRLLFAEPLLSWVLIGAAIVVPVGTAVWKKSFAPEMLGIGIMVVSFAFLLPFSDHLFAYYLNVPLIGGALVVASTMASLVPATRNRILTAGLVVGWVVAFSVIGRRGVGQSRQEDPVGLISKSTIAETVSSRALEAYPSLPADSTLYLTDSDQHSYWAVGLGSMFNLLYGPDLEVRFEHLEPMIESEQNRPRVFVLSLAP